MHSSDTLLLILGNLTLVNTSVSVCHLANPKNLPITPDTLEDVSTCINELALSMLNPLFVDLAFKNGAICVVDDFVGRSVFVTSTGR